MHIGLSDEIIKVIEELIGGYGILFAVAFVTFVFRDFVTNFAAGITFMYGSDFDTDDIVYIDGEKKARIVRQTPTKTVFHSAIDTSWLSLVRLTYELHFTLVFYTPLVSSSLGCP